MVMAIRLGLSVSMGQGLIWQQNGDKQNIREVAMML